MNKLGTNKVTFVIIAVVIAAAIGIGLYAYSTTAIAQITTLGQTANSVAKMYPQATPMPHRATSVNGVNLTTIASSDLDVTIDRTNGESKPKTESGTTTLELQYGVDHDGNDIVATSMTNNGKNTIYITSLILFGQTSEGMEPLNAYVIDASYSPEVFGDIPQPAIVKPVTIAPGQSYSGYVIGKWNASGQPITSFSVGAVYVYDINAKGFVPGNNWSISVDATKLP